MAIGDTGIPIGDMGMAIGDTRVISQSPKWPLASAGLSEWRGKPR
jgi:hypothetical protein